MFGSSILLAREDAVSVFEQELKVGNKSSQD
jgi:hypothetical protein